MLKSVGTNGRKVPKIASLCNFLKFNKNIHSNPDFLAIAENWKSYWKSHYPFVKNDKGKKKYILSMFPYPSGLLHIGHVRVYTISDILSRYYRMKGYKVIHPMGWDAFGLPAENAAIENGISASSWTYENIKKMKEQTYHMNIYFDWDREISTCNPDYYKWSQYLFLQMFHKGLAYQAEATVNWDPVDCTVLANEQVDSHGRSWRSGAIVEKKNLRQWFLKISDYSDQLLDDLETLPKWPDKVKKMQRNWIGRTTGFEISFPLLNDEETLTVFTTKPETIIDVSFIALSKNHKLVLLESQKDPSLAEHLRNESLLDKGYQLPCFAKNPVTGKALPIFYDPYVLDCYGTGAVMGAPIHDRRDFEFAKRNNIIFSKESCIGSYFTNEGKELLNHHDSSNLMDIKQKMLQQKIVSYLEEKKLAKRVKNYRLKDWLISRQRFWGTPIPMVHCETCGAVPVPESELPVKLPDLDKIYEKGTSPLSNLETWMKTTCPKCHGPATRETDTMDTFVDSSWYYFRFLDSKNSELPVGLASASSLMPVDIYIGGVEHSILHLLYSRFFSKFMKDIGLWNGDKYLNEPFTQLITQGMVHGLTYTTMSDERILNPKEVQKIGDEYFLISNPKEKVQLSYQKMSKSKHNGVDPIRTIQKYGSDIIRAYIIFSAPVEGVLLWNENAIMGTKRWLTKIWNCVHQLLEREKKMSDAMRQTKLTIVDDHNSRKLESQYNEFISQCSAHYENVFSLNLVISDAMKLTNNIADALKNNKVNIGTIKASLEVLVKCIAPIIPCFSSECWLLLGHNSSVYSNWPISKNKKENMEELVTIPVQINGKVRFKIEMPKLNDENEILNFVLETNDGKRWLSNKKVLKSFVKQKIISLVTD
ncbi:putative leucine--tRNA ligase, mitochondrial [Schizosaccharomyces pombe]